MKQQIACLINLENFLSKAKKNYLKNQRVYKKILKFNCFKKAVTTKKSLRYKLNLNQVGYKMKS